MWEAMLWELVAVDPEGCSKEGLGLFQGLGSKVGEVGCWLRGLLQAYIVAKALCWEREGLALALAPC